MNSTYITLLAALIVNAVANILIKASTMYSEGNKLSCLMLNPYWISGVASFGIALILYTKALEHLELSLAYPIMTGGGFAIVVFFSWILFSENLSSHKILGYILVWIGILLLTRG